jgi:hypothetical protein
MIQFSLAMRYPVRFFMNPRMQETFLWPAPSADSICNNGRVENARLTKKTIFGNIIGVSVVLMNQITVFL